MQNRFAPGSCENCGSKSHKKKDCLERPRKIPARYSGTIKPTEDAASVPEKLGFDAKRDRWSGFVADNNKEWNMSTQKESVTTAGEAGNTHEATLAHASTKNKLPVNKYIDGDMTTVTNLRVRSDTAKYLLNLDVNSAYYDPKSRSMRDDPGARGSNRDPTSAQFQGDNFVRYSGDAVEAVKARQFAWESYQEGDRSVHETANPTQSIKKLKEAELVKKSAQEQKQKEILEKYKLNDADEK